MFLSLKNPYVAVLRGNQSSYGGNQMLSSEKIEREAGCGVIAGLDLLLYLSRYHVRIPKYSTVSLSEDGTIPLDHYQALIRRLRKSFLPLIPKHGINGLMLALGVNACFIKYQLPFRAFWGVPYAKLWSSIEDMLRQDIPVVFSIGPNFPLVWQRHKLKFYICSDGGVYIPGPQTHAHYVTITGMDDEWLQIASWGRKYYIRRTEYLSYVKDHSMKLVSNILYVVRKKSHGEI